MRIVVAWILGLVLVAGSVMARSAEDGNDGRPKSETASNEAPASTPKDGDPQVAEKPKTKKKPAKPAKSATAILTEHIEERR